MAAARSDVGLLRNGDHLSREEFHRRYREVGEGVRAELIEGIVYLDRCPGDVTNAAARENVLAWLGFFRAKTPGLKAAAHCTLKLDGRNEVQPAGLIAFPAAMGGAARLDENGFFEGAPELICEVRADRYCIDLHPKTGGVRA